MIKYRYFLLLSGDSMFVGMFLFFSKLPALPRTIPFPYANVPNAQGLSSSISLENH